MFSLKGSNHTHSGDGHDKLMGFMKSTFPLAVYGLQDSVVEVMDVKFRSKAGRQMVSGSSVQDER